MVSTPGAVKRPGGSIALNLPGDLEVVLERQPVGHLEQDEQVHQRERHQEGHRAVGQHETGYDHGDLPDVARGEPHLHERNEADQRQEQRDAEHDAPSGRQLQRERTQEEPESGDDAAIPGQPLERFGIDVPGKEIVGFARVAREQPLQIVGFQIARVRIDEGGQPGPRTCARHGRLERRATRI
jgi:hypothetical protein